MSLKSKLTGLERRLGVTLCPHCHGPLPARPEDVEGAQGFGDEERLAILQRIFTRFYERETVLELLAGLNPRLRREIADVYTVQAGECFGDACADSGAAP